MNSLETGYHKIGYNYGYYLDKVPQNILDELGQQISNLQSDFSKGIKNNHELAGQIKHEYKIQLQQKTHYYIRNLSQHFENASQYMVSNYEEDSITYLNISDAWVNFQKKYEYNPMHTHAGIYSFVIWYKIPYKFENEKKYTYSNNDDYSHGQFEFILPNPYSKLRNLSQISIGVDNSKEGYAVMFPSNLNHIVYPFYSSDQYRITVAGNIIPTK